MSISTRRGDSGQTDLLFGRRRAKSHPRIHALGAVDELNAALGLVRIKAQQSETAPFADKVQMTLIALMGELATAPGDEERYRKSHPQIITGDDVQWLDDWVAKLEAGPAGTFDGWSLPGAAGSEAGAHLDIARTVCRRAERVIADLDGGSEAVPNPDVMRYLNRLSDVLFVMARHENHKSELPEDIW